MKAIMTYLIDLESANQFDIIDKYILEFCSEEICFQYYICLLTSATRCKDKLKNLTMLQEKALAVGIAEIGEKDAVQVLIGLI